MELLGLLGNALTWIIGAIGVGVLAWARFSGEKKGAQRERSKQVAADQKARDTISTKRAEVDSLPDDELDKRRSKWTK